MGHVTYRYLVSPTLIHTTSRYQTPVVSLLQLASQRERRGKLDLLPSHRDPEYSVILDVIGSLSWQPL